MNSTNNTFFNNYLKNSVPQSIILDPPQSIEIYNIINSLNLHKATEQECYLLRMENDVCPSIFFVKLL